MKIKTENLMDIPGAGNGSSDRDFLSSTQKSWLQKLGYCSIFAAIPAMLATSEARSDEMKRTEASVPGRNAKAREALNVRRSNPALLKRQSEFRLPHQKNSFDALQPLSGNDDCPGYAIPGGNYTAAAPYIDYGDTTGANNTITRTRYAYYCYYFDDVPGSDQVYSFTLTSRGANPQIQISRTSGSYEPVVYILDSTIQGSNYLGCAAGTGIETCGVVVSSGSGTTGIATISSNQMNYVPLNVPLHLFVDSFRTDARGSGAYMIRMQDVTIAPGATPRAIDNTEFFVRQHYLDFLNRTADDSGLAFWANGINACGADAACIEAHRVNVSAAFFHSIEFQETGYLVYRLYKAAYGNLPGLPVPIKLSEFLPDSQTIGQGLVVNQSGWEQVLENNKQAFALQFVQRSRFTSAFPNSMSPSEFVDRLFTNAAITPLAPDWDAAVAEFGSAGNTADLSARARVLRRVAENSLLTQQEFRRAFVLMQYFGYLRRNPNDLPDSDFSGFAYWLNKLDQFNGDYNAAEMVKAFILSTEYRQRF